MEGNLACSEPELETCPVTYTRLDTPARLKLSKAARKAGWYSSLRGENGRAVAAGFFLGEQRATILTCTGASCRTGKRWLTRLIYLRTQS